MQNNTSKLLDKEITRYRITTNDGKGLDEQYSNLEITKMKVVYHNDTYLILNDPKLTKIAIKPTKYEASLGIADIMIHNNDRYYGTSIYFCLYVLGEIPLETLPYEIECIVCNKQASSVLDVLDLSFITDKKA
jgi:hypothetical protein